MAKATRRVYGAQKEFETQHGKCQPYTQEGGNPRNAEKGEVQDPAGEHERDETHGQEKAATENGCEKRTKTGGGRAGRNHDHRRD
jgi:hypothetical protein